MADIFISYSREDAALAERLAHALAEAGYTSWWDRHLSGGSRYLEATEKELTSAKAVVVVWTRSSIVSHWVADEAGVGRDAGKLIPISPDGSVPPLGFRQFQVIDFGSWINGDRGAFKDLLTALGRHCPQGAPSRTEAADYGKSIAVLPFADMSPAHDQEYFADGLAEALTNLLDHNRALRVAARTSSFAFKGLNRTIADIARELKVSMVLEGSVRKAGDRVRIAVQLIDCTTGFHLWSETYTRQMTDIFEMQDEISEAIAQKLQATVDGAAPVAASRTQNPRAYEAFLEGDFHFGKGESNSWKLAQAAYQRAIDLDPQFAPAYARKARAILQELYLTQDDFVQARTLIDRASSLQPNMPETLYASGVLNFLSGNATSHNAAMERLIAVAPESPFAALGQIRLHALRLEYRQTFPFIERITQLDPLGPETNVTVCLVLSSTDRMAEAVSRLRRASEYNPMSIQLKSVLATLLLQEAATLEAVRLFLDTLAVAPIDRRSRIFLGIVLARCGFDEEVERLTKDPLLRGLFGGSRLPRAEDIPPSYLEPLRPVVRGAVLWRANGLVAAKPHFEEAYRAGPQTPTWAFVNPGEFKIPLLAARRLAGEVEAAAALERELRDDIARGEANGWTRSGRPEFRMQFAAATGDARTFGEIGHSVSRGDLDMGGRNFNDPLYDPIRDSPEFVSVQRRVEESWRGHREEFIASGMIDRVRSMFDAWEAASG